VPKVPPQGLTAELDDLCLTAGKTNGEASRRDVRDPKMRGVFRRSRGDELAVRFRYDGATEVQQALGSGLSRRQLGLKLLARDPCNLVYVMWRLEPKSEVVVSVKSNPGAHASRDCGNSGYSNLRPSLRNPPPALEPGSEHELAAVVAGQALRVTIDGATVWEGALPSEAAALRGPAGVRSDNVRWSIVGYRAPADASARPAPCGDGD
jgi:hypothetical protein